MKWFLILAMVVCLYASSTAQVDLDNFMKWHEDDYYGELSNNN